MSQYLAFQEAKNRLEKHNDESVRRLLANETIWNNISESSNVIRQNLLALLNQKVSQEKLCDDIYVLLILLAKYFPRNEFAQNEGQLSGYICKIDDVIIAEPVYTAAGYQYDARNINRLLNSVNRKRDWDYVVDQGIQLNLIEPRKQVDTFRRDAIFIRAFLISSLVLTAVLAAAFAPWLSGMLLLVILAGPAISLIGSHIYANYAYDREVKSRTNLIQNKIDSLVEIAERPAVIPAFEVLAEIEELDDEVEFVEDQPGLAQEHNVVEEVAQDDADEEITGEMDHEPVQVEVQGEPDHPVVAPQLLRWMNQGERNDPVMDNSPRRLSR